MSAPAPRRVESSPVDAYSIRAMLGLVASLSLMLALVHLPLEFPVARVGWSAHSTDDQIVLDDVWAEGKPETGSGASGTEQVPGSAPPATTFQLLSSEESPTAASAPDVEDSSSPPDTTRSRQFKKVQSVTELGISNRTPYIVGGVGSLYLHIDYPQKAVKKGIEGRLALEFTVRRDGSVTDLKVVDSLHPLCDSAAVEGVRAVEFIPASQDGDPIPVRLRLPVHFQLKAASPALSEDQSP